MSVGSLILPNNTRPLLSIKHDTVSYNQAHTSLYW